MNLNFCQNKQCRYFNLNSEEYCCAPDFFANSEHCQPVDATLQNEVVLDSGILGTRLRFLKISRYLKNAAETYRTKLQSSTPLQTYRSGYDIGYALGSVHAYEDILNRLRDVPQKDASELKKSSDNLNLLNRYGVDTQYFKRELSRLSESLPDRTPDELYRYLLRLAEVAKTQNRK